MGSPPPGRQAGERRREGSPAARRTASGARRARCKAEARRPPQFRARARTSHCCQPSSAGPAGSQLLTPSIEASDWRATTDRRAGSWPRASSSVPSNFLRPARQQQQLVAQALGVLHDVGGKNDGGAVRRKAPDLVLEKPLVDRVEAGERLVEDQQPRPVDHGGRELDLLRHALGQFVDRRARIVAEPEAVEQCQALRSRIVERSCPSAVRNRRWCRAPSSADRARALREGSRCRAHWRGRGCGRARSAGPRSGG